MNKVNVKINGLEYPMVSEKPKEHMIQLAHYVDEEMEMIKQANTRLSTSQVAVLTALTITDLLFDCSKENDEVRKELEELKKQGDTPSKEIQEQITELKAQLEKYKEDIETKDLEIEIANECLKEKEDELSSISETNVSEQDKVTQLEETIAKLKEENEKYQKDMEETESRYKSAINISSDFQNKLYDLQLQYIELEHKLQLLENKEVIVPQK